MCCLPARNIRVQNFTKNKFLGIILITLFQTLNSISAEKNSTIIFPLPIDFLTHFMGKKDGGSKSGGANMRGNRKTSTSGGGGGGGSNGNKSDCSSDGSIRHKED